MHEGGGHILIRYFKLVFYQACSFSSPHLRGTKTALNTFSVPHIFTPVGHIAILNWFLPRELEIALRRLFSFYFFDLFFVHPSGGKASSFEGYVFHL